LTFGSVVKRLVLAGYTSDVVERLKREVDFAVVEPCMHFVHEDMLVGGNVPSVVDPKVRSGVAFGYHKVVNEDNTAWLSARSISCEGSLLEEVQPCSVDCVMCCRLRSWWAKNSDAGLEVHAKHVGKEVTIGGFGFVVVYGSVIMTKPEGRAYPGTYRRESVLVGSDDVLKDLKIMVRSAGLSVYPGSDQFCCYRFVGDPAVVRRLVQQHGWRERELSKMVVGGSDVVCMVVDVRNGVRSFEDSDIDCDETTCCKCDG
jgi:hypothetical protein